MRLLITATALLALGLPPLAQALKSDKDQPVDLTARSVDADEKTGISIYQDNAVIVRGSLHVRADRIEIVTRDDEIEIARAWGRPIAMRQRPEGKRNDAYAEADRMIYYAKEDRVEMYENVTLRHLPDGKEDELQAAADRLIYYTAEDKVDMFGHVTLRRDRDLLIGETLHYDIDAERVLIRSAADGGRIRAVIQPKKKPAAAKP